MEREVTINAEWEQYVIPEGEGFSCLGFDVCMRRIDRYAHNLVIPVPQVKRGTMEAYETMRGLVAALEHQFQTTGERAVADLTPQLIGKEGRRVRVIRSEGEPPVEFTVGKSMGWLPIHLEIDASDDPDSDGVGGMGCLYHYYMVEVIG
jgi:hypothetical protein